MVLGAEEGEGDAGSNGHVELLEDPRDVMACGVGADVEAIGHLGIGGAAREEDSNLRLPCRQAEPIFHDLLRKAIHHHENDWGVRRARLQDAGSQLVRLRIPIDFPLWGSDMRA